MTVLSKWASFLYSQLFKWYSFEYFQCHVYLFYTLYSDGERLEVDHASIFPMWWLWPIVSLHILLSMPSITPSPPKRYAPLPPFILLPFPPCWEKMYVCSVLDNGVHVSAFTPCSQVLCSLLFLESCLFAQVLCTQQHMVYTAANCSALALNLLVKLLLYGNGVLLWAD